MTAPLAVSDGEGPISYAETGVRGDDGGFPRGGDGGGPGDQDPSGVPLAEPPPPPPPRPTLMRRVLGYLRFAWAFLESVMISMTTYLNKFSRDYRHVSRCLAEEKQQLKVS